MTEYLASVPVVATHRLEEAREAVSRIYLRHNLTSRDGALNMRFNATADSHMTLGYLTYQADAELTMPPTEDCYIVNVTIEGETRAFRGDGCANARLGTSGVWCCHRFGTIGFTGPLMQSNCT